MEDIERIDAHYSTETEPQLVQGDEYRLLHDCFVNADIEVDNAIKEMYFECDDVITGTCHVCGTQTTGTANGDDVTYSEYLEFYSKEQQESWFCEDCYLKSLQDDDSASV